MRSRIPLLLVLSLAGAVALPLHAKTRAPSQDHVFWDSWYTVTVKKKFHYGYYNDRFEVKGGRAFFQNRFWKKEENFVNEEQLGAFAENTPALTPLFFNFHSMYRTTETLIDGNIQDGRIFTAKVKKADKELPLIKRSLPSKIILSVFFPVWLGRRLKEAVPGHWISFMALQEDSADNEFETTLGRVRLEKPDSFCESQKGKVLKVSVNYRDLASTWYVEPNGNAVRIEMPSQQTVVERVSQSIASHFLDE